MPSQKVDYADLIDIPFEMGGRTLDGIDCVGISKMILERRGVKVPPGAFPEEYLTVEEVCAHIQVQSATVSASPWSKHWDMVPRAMVQAGDMAFFSDGRRAHVAVIVSRRKGPGGITVLTTTPKHGTRPMPIERLRHLVGFYQLRTS